MTIDLKESDLETEIAGVKVIDRAMAKRLALKEPLAHGMHYDTIGPQNFPILVKDIDKMTLKISGVTFTYPFQNPSVLIGHSSSFGTQWHFYDGSSVQERTERLTRKGINIALIIACNPGKVFIKKYETIHSLSLNKPQGADLPKIIYFPEKGETNILVDYYLGCNTHYIPLALKQKLLEHPEKYGFIHDKERQKFAKVGDEEIPIALDIVKKIKWKKEGTYTPDTPRPMTPEDIIRIKRDLTTFFAEMTRSSAQ